MPFVISCPTCRHPLTAHESQAGVVVACPTCQYPLTVPGVAPGVTSEANEPEPFDAIDTPEESRPVRRQERDNGALTMAALVGAFVLVCAGVVGGWLAFGRGEKPADAPKSDAAAKQPAPPLPAPVQVAKVKGSPEVVQPTPKDTGRPSPTTFDEAMAEALKIADQLDNEEPEKTRKALALLTQVELLESGALIVKGNAFGDWANFDRTLPTKLRRVGLSAWLDRLSRKIALQDPRFKDVARVLWEPRTGPDGLVAMMNVWGTFPQETRSTVNGAVTSGTRAALLQVDTRDAILDLVQFQADSCASGSRCSQP